MKLKLVDRGRYELLERIAERTDNYIVQIKSDMKKIDSLENKIEELEDLIKGISILFQEKENQRRKAASKIGGLQASLNKEKAKSKELLDYQFVLENKIDEKVEQMEIKDLEIKTKDAEIQMLRDKGKKKNVEVYKNYFECRKELEKRSKDAKDND